MKNTKRFNLKILSFRKYLIDKAGMAITPNQIDFWQNWSIRDILTRKDFTYKNCEPVSKKDRKEWSKTVRINRKKIQKYWEAYKNEKRSTKIRKR